ncbi:hypothetical protein [Streptomyces sp. DH8]|uniref:hypothetical protein n=1 Tax=Streptomyces sp. DH8 TaxID=2857008 RepID=UPI001E4F7A38|nr:hypothetical protein [Streptomyces sp. DH8]
MKSNVGTSRVLASLSVLASAGLGAFGLTVLVPGTEISGGLEFSIPAAVAIAAMLGVHYVADPLLTRKRELSPRNVSRLLSSMTLSRVVAAQSATVTGLVAGAAFQSDPAVLVGCGASAVMLAHWWPGKQFVNTVRARLAPRGQAHLVDPAPRPIG